MININISVYYPFKRSNYHNSKCKTYTVSKNKQLELQYNGASASIITIAAAYSYAVDHGGLFLELGILGKNISLNLYDNRHWNEHTNDYV